MTVTAWILVTLVLWPDGSIHRYDGAVYDGLTAEIECRADLPRTWLWRAVLESSCQPEQ